MRIRTFGIGSLSFNKSIKETPIFLSLWTFLRVSFPATNLHQLIGLLTNPKNGPLII